jgi:hypothetical protein
MTTRFCQTSRPCCWCLTLLLGGGGLAGCAGIKPDRPDIQSDDANRRILAIRVAGQTKDRNAVPLLVDRLEDEDEAVRFFAILALERITGQRFGYDYGRSSGDRAPAVQRWRDYVRRKEHLIAADGAATPVGEEKRQTAASGT